jgi:hypothetical protein
MNNMYAINHVYNCSLKVWNNLYVYNKNAMGLHGGCYSNDGCLSVYVLYNEHIISVNTKQTIIWDMHSHSNVHSTVT